LDSASKFAVCAALRLCLETEFFYHTTVRASLQAIRGPILKTCPLALRPIPSSPYAYHILIGLEAIKDYTRWPLPRNPIQFRLNRELLPFAVYCLSRL